MQVSLKLKVGHMQAKQKPKVGHVWLILFHIFSVMFTVIMHYTFLIMFSEVRFL